MLLRAADRSDRQRQIEGREPLPGDTERSRIADCEVVTIVEETFTCEGETTRLCVDRQRKNRRPVVILREDEIRLFAFSKRFCRKKIPSMTLKQARIGTHK